MIRSRLRSYLFLRLLSSEKCILRPISSQKLNLCEVRSSEKPKKYENDIEKARYYIENKIIEKFKQTLHIYCQTNKSLARYQVESARDRFIFKVDSLINGELSIVIKHIDYERNRQSTILHLYTAEAASKFLNCLNNMIQAMNEHKESLRYIPVDSFHGELASEEFSCILFDVEDEPFELKYIFKLYVDPESRYMIDLRHKNPSLLPKWFTFVIVDRIMEEFRDTMSEIFEKYGNDDVRQTLPEISRLQLQKLVHKEFLNCRPFFDCDPSQPPNFRLDVILYKDKKLNNLHLSLIGKDVKLYQIENIQFSGYNQIVTFLEILPRIWEKYQEIKKSGQDETLKPGDVIFAEYFSEDIFTKCYIGLIYHPESGKNVKNESKLEDFLCAIQQQFRRGYSHKPTKIIEIRVPLQILPPLIQHIDHLLNKYPHDPAQTVQALEAQVSFTAKELLYNSED